MSPDFLRSMYHSEGVNISEVLLFRLLCEMPGHLQEELLPLIRLPLIRPADILKFVLPSKLVEKDELIRVLAFKADPTDVDLPTHHDAKRRCVRHIKGSAMTLHVYCAAAGAPVDISVGKLNSVRDLKNKCCAYSPRSLHHHVPGWNDVGSIKSAKNTPEAPRKNS